MFPTQTSTSSWASTARSTAVSPSFPSRVVPGVLVRNLLSAANERALSIACLHRDSQKQVFLAPETALILAIRDPRLRGGRASKNARPSAHSDPKLPIPVSESHGVSVERLRRLRLEKHLLPVPRLAQGNPAASPWGSVGHTISRTLNSQYVPV